MKDIEVLNDDDWKAVKFSSIKCGEVFISKDRVDNNNIDVKHIGMKIDNGKNNTVCLTDGRVYSTGPNHMVFDLDSKIFVIPRRIK